MAASSSSPCVSPISSHESVQLDIPRTSTETFTSVEGFELPLKNDFHASDYDNLDDDVMSVTGSAIDGIEGAYVKDAEETTLTFIRPREVMVRTPTPGPSLVDSDTLHSMEEKAPTIGFLVESVVNPGTQSSSSSEKDSRKASEKHHASSGNVSETRKSLRLKKSLNRLRAISKLTCTPLKSINKLDTFATPTISAYTIHPLSISRGTDPPTSSHPPNVKDSSDHLKTAIAPSQPKTLIRESAIPWSAHAYPSGLVSITFPLWIVGLLQGSIPETGHVMKTKIKAEAVKDKEFPADVDLVLGLDMLGYHRFEMKTKLKWECGDVKVEGELVLEDRDELRQWGVVVKLGQL
ncbi:MAG: hypothetical protein Q9159_004219 [Coniocarpon cinnabarinum]